MCIYPASIQLSNDSFHQKHRQEYIAEDFNANTIAVAGSQRVCGDPVMTRSPKFCTHNHTSIWNKVSKFDNDMIYVYDFIKHDMLLSCDFTCISGCIRHWLFHIEQQHYPGLGDGPAILHR